mgnify:CR=1 FL=1
MYPQSTIPLGLCQCGCGQFTKIAPRTSTTIGWIKGQPQRFLCNHHRRGIPSVGGGSRPVPLVDRFWAKVDKHGPVPEHCPELGPCWLWLGALNRDGYGDIARTGRRGGRTKSHRYSWELHFGPIPTGKEVCHHCDNPPCPNPRHLFLGTQKDNIRDMLTKGRGGQLRGANGRYVSHGTPSGTLVWRMV